MLVNCSRGFFVPRTENCFDLVQSEGFEREFAFFFDYYAVLIFEDFTKNRVSLIALNQMERN